MGANPQEVRSFKADEDLPAGVIGVFADVGD